MRYASTFLGGIMGLDLTGLGTLGSSIKGIIDKFVPDAGKAQELTNELTGKVTSFLTDWMNAQRDVIVAEAKGESWLQRNWRPLVMLNFTVLITAYFFGFVAPNITENVLLAIFDILEIGIGGYVLGRSGEKIASTLGVALLKGKGK